MNASTTSPRAPAAILADIGAIHNPVKGTLSKVAKTLKNGESSTYYVFQYWENKRHVSVYLDEKKAVNVQEGIDRHKKLKRLFDELAQNGRTAVLTGAAEDPAEKKKRTSSKTSTPRRRQAPASPSRPSPK
jgi:hypothetical protein